MKNGKFGAFLGDLVISTALFGLTYSNGSDIICNCLLLNEYNPATLKGRMYMTKSQRFCMRLMSCVLCIAAVFITVQPASAAVASWQKPAGQTLTTKIRSGPTYEAAVIGRMEHGTEITVLGEHKDYYYEIDCYDMTGFIAMGQVQRREDGKYYVNCKGSSPDTEVLKYETLPNALLLRHSLLSLAQQQLGIPYVYGGVKPDGFDCSGFTYYLYAEHNISLYRTASQQLENGIIVAKEGMQVGDLVFFRETNETFPASHVGIYAGNNQIIHAGRETGISYASLDDSYFSDYYLCARRIVNTEAAKLVVRAVSSQTMPIFGITQSVSGRKAG